MTRRAFAAVLAGLSAAQRSYGRSRIVLEAVVAARRPDYLVIEKTSGIQIAEDDTRWFEVRVYQSPSPKLDGILAKTGIHPMLRLSRGDEVTFLIPFDSLAARETAWARFNAHPEWMSTRDASGRVSQIAIYRRYPGGRIFEMSL
jgi:hypothetical protein